MEKNSWKPGESQEKLENIKEVFKDQGFNLDEMGDILESLMAKWNTLTDAQKKQAEETYDLMNIMKYLIMCDVNDGWEIKPGWKATLCDESTNEAMRNANVKNVYAEDIKKRRKDALRLIDNILLQPLSMFNNLDDIDLQI